MGISPLAVLTVISLSITLTLGNSPGEGGVSIYVIYDLELARLNGKAESLATYKGKVVMAVNVASKCGFTPQYAGLEKLYERYSDRGFTVLGFPCNQFGRQEPGEAEQIEQFCRVNYGVTFPMFAKIDVKGPDQAPLYALLSQNVD